MALEGVGGKFRLADFDEIGLSNLNRLETRISDLGENKAVIAARRMLELNPFLQIEIFCEGVTESNMSCFFGNLDRLDVLVEECDELWMKVRLREEARAQRVAVVMETSDRGLLDIERFDRDPSRSLFHGLIGRSRVAPPESGTIVGAHTRALGHSGLHERPVDGVRAAAGDENNGRAALAGAVQMQLAAANVDESAWGGVGLR